MAEGTSHSAAIALELFLRPAMPQTHKLKNRSRRHGGPAPKSRTAPRRHKPKRGVVRKADDTGLVRLQKVLAAAGIGSRRQCEEIIRQGRVDVDGKTVSELGTRVDPFQHKIRVDGETVSRPKRRLYFLINKPVGILSTNQDPSGRPRVIDLAPSRERLFTVGRLDKTSEGLILATNDGQLTDLLTHPRYGVEKTYWALVAGSVSPEAVSKLERGVHLAEGYAHAKRVTVRRSHKQSTILEIVLDEGRNREVRRLLARIGHKVLKLRRIAIGPLRLGNMKPGENRPLLRDEVEALYEAARERRRQSDKGTKKPSTRLKTAADSQGLDTSDASAREDEVRPLIDHSLSPDEMNEQDAISIDDGLDDELHDDGSGNELGFEGLADGDESFEESNQEPATARVDLSPILPGKPGRGSERTLIGADPQRRKNFRSSRRRSGQGGKPKGRAGGQKRRRP
jgi:23S rRNA pseudouridine2605 synthase